jgi:hypothetical protein
MDQRVFSLVKFIVINLVYPYPELVQCGGIVDQVHTPGREKEEATTEPYENL